MAKFHRIKKTKKKKKKLKKWSKNLIQQQQQTVMWKYKREHDNIVLKKNYNNNIGDNVVGSLVGSMAGGCLIVFFCFFNSMKNKYATAKM